MTNDNTWQLLRYALIGGGAYLAGRFHLSAHDMANAVDHVISFVGGMTSLGSAAWGLYVKWQTTTVPAATGRRVDVPTVHPVTGEVLH